ncbi:unnamed protein product [Rotaria sp. Silwood2]|nr:unnamed protein product [Rotaria sp. Silwood2]CAF2975936.1 unnamed protein product [Rotaria sp. Silwood2]CAF3367607.1 unnamed protein product [Rotaria sp. Silwood2]CAF4003146.1 unnamed protein product [Rotaria sp. Silwood2]CAF4066189.1 unnamed protein product [Rotaria sp. Silwood2]
MNPREQVSTEKTTKTPSQDGQGRWYELLSPTQVLTGHEDTTATTTTTTQKTKKKKCRGNRRAQRQRRKLRRQEEKKDNDENIADIDEDLSNMAEEEEEDEQPMETLSGQSQQRMRATNKRKRQEKNNDQTEHLSQSLSQLSVSQPKAKKQATTEAMTATEKEDPLPYNHIRRYKPSYLKVPDHVFVRMLAKAITGEGFWGSELARAFAKQHRTCRAYGLQKHTIEKRQTTLQNQMQHTIEALQRSLEQLEENAQQWQPSFDPHIIAYAIDECVKNGQKRLRDEFEYKKKMLVINMDDHYLIHSFYELQPTKEQVSS